MDPITLALLLERLAWIFGGVTVVFGWSQRNSWVYPLLKGSAGWALAHRPGVEVQRKLDLLVHQLYPNGGTSLFDKVTALRDGQLEIKEKLLLVQVQGEMGRDGAGMCTFVTDASGGFISCSRPLLALACMEMSAMRGLGWKNAIDQEVLPEWVAIWSSAIEDRRDVLGQTVLRCPLTGELTIVRCNAFCIHSDERVLGWVGRFDKLERLL